VGVSLGIIGIGVVLLGMLVFAIWNTMRDDGDDS